VCVVCVVFVCVVCVCVCVWCVCVWGGVCGVCVCVCVCVCVVALRIQHAMHMRLISSVACSALQYFSTLPYKSFSKNK